ncbi:MAG: tRNA threonylcarbamoyladenosine dehydratase [Bacilli bacterium]|nr:tRNA threonylcarbamoyladenosine dehydratase [Bacilli bacterium]
MEFERFKLLVKDNFSKIENKSVLIIGVGGVGGYVAESLARCGVSSITIVDSDIVDITNLNRQIIALHSTIGMKKVDVLKTRILDINPNCNVSTFDCFYEESNKDIIFDKKYDYIIDACDTIKSKELLIREAKRRSIKIISSMGAGFKFDPSKIKVSKLKKTSYDKIASILRHNLRDDKELLEIPVVYSEETFSRHEKTIASNSYIPAIFGLFITSFIIKEWMEEVS